MAIGLVPSADDPFFFAILIYHKVSNEVENDSTR